MATDLLDLYERASAWTTEKVAGATAQMDSATPCDKWTVQTLLDHMLETQQYFLASAQGAEASPPSKDPPHLVSDDPASDFNRVRNDMQKTFGDPAVIEKTGPSLGIAFSDLLLHGWDVARATGQDTTMPKGLPEAAYKLIHGKFTDEQRKGVFKPEIPVGDNASPQARLLAYSGRTPD